MDSIKIQLEKAKSAFNTGLWRNAETLCKNILSVHPDHLETRYLLASIYQGAGKFERAIEEYQRIIDRHGANGDLLNNLGIACESMQQTGQALGHYQQALQHNHTHIPARYNLGRVQRTTGNLEDAISTLKIALTVAPKYCPVLIELAMTLKAMGNYSDALLYLNRALEITPADPVILNILGNIRQLQGKLEQAIDCYQSALRLKPDYAEAYNNLGATYLARGDVANAIINYKHAVKSNPGWEGVKSNVLLARNYLSNDPEMLFKEHLQWARDMEKTIRRDTAIAPETKGSRIRIGYLSPDFRMHSVAYFISALLENHDKTAFEPVCFSDVARQDSMTRQLQSHASAWHNICGKTDSEVYQLIQACGIDILVDLAGHTANNRLGLFAMQAAPIQVSYLGYPNTTGLSTMQYRITDNQADPDGRADLLHSEELVRLPDGFLCYTPLAESPKVTELPVLANEYITFGSFNVVAKISDECIQSWSRILGAVPGSRILVKSAGLEDSGSRNYMMERFAHYGITAEQVELLDRTADFLSHMETYQRVDIALDTFPYNGTTTTCEALWMGVPVLSLAGNSHAGRVGCSLLNQAGLQELIATTTDEYVLLARQLSLNIRELHKLRHCLRDRLTSSSLCNGPCFTRSFEAACQTMLEKTGC